MERKLSITAYGKVAGFTIESGKLLVAFGGSVLSRRNRLGLESIICGGFIIFWNTRQGYVELYVLFVLERRVFLGEEYVGVLYSIWCRRMRDSQIQD
jgi:hypothetical protein